MIIDSIKYRTQKSLKSKVSSIISILNASNNLGHVDIHTNTEYFKFWNDLFKRHPTKAHFNPTSFRLEKPFHMYFNIGNYTDSFSYNDCITSKTKSKKNDYFGCLRSSIEPQIKIFRNDQSPLKCNHCNIADSNLKYEVDHEISFKTLYNDFIKTVDGVEIDDFKMKYNSTKHRIFFDLSDDYTKSLHDLWIDFHNENAKLQILCKECHLHKTKLK